MLDNLRGLKLPASSIIPLILLLSFTYVIILSLNLYKSPFFPSGESPDFYYHLSSSFQLSKGSTSFLLTFYPPLTHFIGAFFILLSPNDPIFLFKSGFLALSVLAIPLLFIVSRDLAKDNLIASIATLLYIFFSPIWYYSQIEAYLYPTMLAFILFLIAQIVFTRAFTTHRSRYIVSLGVLIPLLIATHYYVLPLSLIYLLSLFSTGVFILLKQKKFTYHLVVSTPLIISLVTLLIGVPSLYLVLKSLFIGVFTQIPDPLIAPSTSLSYVLRNTPLSDFFKIGYSDLYALLILLSLPATALSIVLAPWGQRGEHLLLVAPIIGWTLILLAISIPSQSWRTTHALYLALTPLSVYPLLLLKKGVERL